MMCTLYLFVDGPALGLAQSLALLLVVDDFGVLGPRGADRLPRLEAPLLLHHGELLGHVERLEGVAAAVVGLALDLGVDVLVGRGGKVTLGPRKRKRQT